MPRRFWYRSMLGPVWTRLDLAATPDEAALDVVVRTAAVAVDAALSERLSAGVRELRRRGCLPISASCASPRARSDGTEIGNNVGAFVIVLLTTAVLLTLLIACTNVAVLMMAQWTSREHEIAIRASLGGGPRPHRALAADRVDADRRRRRHARRRGDVCAPRVAYRNVPTAGAVRPVDRLAIILMSGLITLAAGLLTGVAPAFYETRRLHVNPLNADSRIRSGAPALASRAGGLRDRGDRCAARVDRRHAVVVRARA